MARQYDHADRAAFAQEGNAENGSIAAQFLCVAISEVRVRENFGTVDDPAVKQYTSGDRAAISQYWPSLDELHEGGWKVEGRHPVVRPALGSHDTRHLRLAKQRGGLGQRIEHRLQIERQAADHPEHVGGRGLLLSRL